MLGSSLCGKTTGCRKKSKALMRQIAEDARCPSRRATGQDGFLAPWHTASPRLLHLRCSHGLVGLIQRGLALARGKLIAMKELLWNSGLNYTAGATGHPNASFFNSTSMLNASTILLQWYLTMTSVIVPVTIHSYFLSEEASFQLPGCD